MRFVLFDDETTEPITVINLHGMAERDIWERIGPRLRLPVARRMVIAQKCNAAPSEAICTYVEIWFERLVRNGVHHLMAFTREAELAMLLDPDWLPGQRAKVADLEGHARRIEDLLFTAMARRKQP